MWDHAQVSHTVGPPPTTLPTVTCVSSVHPPSTMPPLYSSTMPRSVPTSPPGVVCMQGAEMPIRHPFPLLQVSQSPSPMQAVPRADPHLGSVQPIAPVPTTPAWQPVIMTCCSPAVPQMGLGDEAVYWVVTSGANPGVYLGN